MITTMVSRPLGRKMSLSVVTLLGDLLGDGTSAPGTATQAVKGLAEVLPAAQLVQAPPLVEVLPAAQLVQAPPLVEVLPAAQSVQALPLVEVLPAAQLVQAVKGLAEVLPATQSLHSAFPVSSCHLPT